LGLPDGAIRAPEAAAFAAAFQRFGPLLSCA
jgi:hypothetical protein